MKKVFAVFMLLCFLICLTPIRPAKADSFPSEFMVNSNVYYSAGELGNAYLNLNSEQKDIAHYLLGMYNLFYLGSRGFQFEAGAYTNESSFIAKIKSLGYKILYGAVDIAIYSRFDDEFCKYASAVILYASQCNTDFDTWFQNLDQNFIIPVDQGILNSFTLFYNDNDYVSIGNWGDTSSPWQSGELFEFSFNGLVWGSSSDQQDFNDVIQSGNYLFSQVYQFGSSPSNSLQAIAHDFRSVPNVLYILRSGNNSYNSFRFGIISNNQWSLLDAFASCIVNAVRKNGSNNKLYYDSYAATLQGYDKGILSSPFNDLSQTIEYAFNKTPIKFSILRDGVTINFSGAYPFIEHVVLVDNLDTLSNPVEIFNTDSWDIIGNDSNMLVPVDKVDFKPKILTTIDLPDNSSNPVSIQDMINEDNTQDENGDPVNPWQITIVVQPNNTNPISIDVNMFSSAKVYIKYLWDNATAFLSYCKNLLDCFAFTDVNGADYGPKYAIYGVIVLGVASGLIAKFLL